VKPEAVDQVFEDISLNPHKEELRKFGLIFSKVQPKKKLIEYLFNI